MEIMMNSNFKALGVTFLIALSSKFDYKISD